MVNIYPINGEHQFICHSSSPFSQVLTVFTAGSSILRAFSWICDWTDSCRNSWMAIGPVAAMLLVGSGSCDAYWCLLIGLWWVLFYFLHNSCHHKPLIHQKLNLVYDLHSSCLIPAWFGPFLDVLSHWQSHGGRHRWCDSHSGDPELGAVLMSGIDKLS